MHRIVIEESILQNGNCRSFHITTQVSNQEGVLVRKYPSFISQLAEDALGYERLMHAMSDLEGQFDTDPQISTEELQEAAGQVGYDLAQKIIKIEGVLRVILHPFQVDVEKGTAFEWKTITPAIERHLLETFKARGINDVDQESHLPEDMFEIP